MTCVLVSWNRTPKIKCLRQHAFSTYHNRFLAASFFLSHEDKCTRVLPYQIYRIPQSSRSQKKNRDAYNVGAFFFANYCRRSVLFLLVRILLVRIYQKVMVDSNNNNNNNNNLYNPNNNPSLNPDPTRSHLLGSL